MKKSLNRLLVLRNKRCVILQCKFLGLVLKMDLGPLVTGNKVRYHQTGFLFLFQIRHVINMHWKELQAMNEKTEFYEDTNFWCLIYWTLMDRVR